MAGYRPAPARFHRRCHGGLKEHSLWSRSVIVPQRSPPYPGQRVVVVEVARSRPGIQVCDLFLGVARTPHFSLCSPLEALRQRRPALRLKCQKSPDTAIVPARKSRNLDHRPTFPRMESCAACAMVFTGAATRRAFWKWAMASFNRHTAISSRIASFTAEAWLATLVTGVKRGSSATPASPRALHTEPVMLITRSNQHPTVLQRVHALGAESDTPRRGSGPGPVVRGDRDLVRL